MDITKTFPKKTLAVFDLDGTITSGDTMIEFIVFAKGKTALYFSYLGLSFTLFFYKLGLLDNASAKKKLLKWHFKGMAEPELNRLGMEFCEKILPSMVRARALERISWHKKKGHRIAIVSSSLEIWMKPWCIANQLDCIATVPQYENGIFLGAFNSPNCYGPEKVNRIKEKVPADSYEFVYAYGDTTGDKEMMAFADMWYFKPFR